MAIHGAYPGFDAAQIVQKCAEAFIMVKSLRGGHERRVLTCCQQHGHQWVALFASFILGDVVHCALAISNKNVDRVL